MALARRVGLGLASRGKVSDAVGWAERARAAGLESVWFHDSYFERDAVTYASAVASQVHDIGIGLGALNPFTRHPVLIAMTVSSLDEMAPSRIRLGLGSALPLRLGQMGIPYSPDEAATRTTATIDTLHQLWAGERIPAGKQGLPPLQPMFPPVHRVPIYIAGYRSPMMVVAGQKGDGYLARPAESIPGLRKLLRVMDRAAREAGRDPDSLDVAGYLLTFIDETRRDALNRAKRDPFVIYMMSILSDVTLKRAGFEPENRDRIAAKWRAEDYTGAGALIADELLDAYILCCTRREVAERAHAYHEAGMDLPLLQPVVQEEARHILFFVNWVKYRRSQLPWWKRPAFRLRCAWIILKQVASRIKTARTMGGASDSSDNFTMSAHQEVGESVTLHSLLEVCLSENDRRMGQYDARLLRPRLVPVLAKFAYRVLPASI